MSIENHKRIIKQFYILKFNILHKLTTSYNSKWDYNKNLLFNKFVNFLESFDVNTNTKIIERKIIKYYSLTPELKIQYDEVKKLYPNIKGIELIHKIYIEN